MLSATDHAFRKIILHNAAWQLQRRLEEALPQNVEKQIATAFLD
jgi:hypothetical protein